MEWIGLITKAGFGFDFCFVVEWSGAFSVPPGDRKSGGLSFDLTQSAFALRPFHLAPECSFAYPVEVEVEERRKKK